MYQGIQGVEAENRRGQDPVAGDRLEHDSGYSARPAHAQESAELGQAERKHPDGVTRAYHHEDRAGENQEERDQQETHEGAPILNAATA